MMVSKFISVVRLVMGRLVLSNWQGDPYTVPSGRLSIVGQVVPEIRPLLEGTQMAPESQPIPHSSGTKPVLWPCSVKSPFLLQRGAPLYIWPEELYSPSLSVSCFRSLLPRTAGLQLNVNKLLHRSLSSLPAPWLPVQAASWGCPPHRIVSA